MKQLSQNSYVNQFTQDVDDLKEKYFSFEGKPPQDFVDELLDAFNDFNRQDDFDKELTLHSKLELQEMLKTLDL